MTAFGWHLYEVPGIGRIKIPYDTLKPASLIVEFAPEAAPWFLLFSLIPSPMSLGLFFHVGHLERETLGVPGALHDHTSKTILRCVHVPLR